MLRSMLTVLRRWRYPGAQKYWEKRYSAGGDSGDGSSGVLAVYKQQMVNDFVRVHNIRSVLELGCGDGRQLQLASYPSYTGLDIAPSAVARCRALFEADASKRFAVYDPYRFEPSLYRAELAISLEVIFHLTEQDLYERYLQHLFASAERYVVIFSSDTDDRSGGIFPHFRERRFSADIPRLAPDWRLSSRIDNPHRNISVSDFFFFEKIIK